MLAAGWVERPQGVMPGVEMKFLVLSYFRDKG